MACTTFLFYPFSLPTTSSGCVCSERSKVRSMEMNLSSPVAYPIETGASTEFPRRPLIGNPVNRGILLPQELQLTLRLFTMPCYKPNNR